MEKICKALAELKNPPMDAVNPHFKSRYSSLATVLDTIRPVLGKHGLAVMQPVQATADSVKVETLIIGDGEPYNAGSMQIDGKLTPQQMGSAITYLRRYSLLSALGIAGDEDDDANSAEKAPVKKPEAKKEPSPALKEVGKLYAEVKSMLSPKQQDYFDGVLTGKTAYTDAAAARDIPHLQKLMEEKVIASDKKLSDVMKEEEDGIPF